MRKPLAEISPIEAQANLDRYLANPPPLGKLSPTALARARYYAQPEQEENTDA